MYHCIDCCIGYLKQWSRYVDGYNHLEQRLKPLVPGIIVSPPAYEQLL